MKNNENRARRRVCVFCASACGVDGDFRAAAEALGREIAAAGWGLVYGGANVGLMGAMADAVIGAGGETIGVIPRALQEKEVAHPHLSELYVVETMHERKKKMVDHADAFVALPGGFGTLDEFFEVLTWAQLGIHDKPCVLVNVQGYFEGLLGFLDTAVTCGFLQQKNRDLIRLVNVPQEVIPLLERLLPEKLYAGSSQSHEYPSRERAETVPKP